jgi:hypothetical protein
VQTLNESVNSMPTKSVRSKIPKHNSTPKRMEDIHEMMKITMNKLDKLDVTEQRFKNI